MLVHIFYPV